MSSLSVPQKRIGIYLHVPFCVKKCNYCNFFSCTNLSLIDDYVSSLCIEISKCENVAYGVDSIYFGGGTPNLLSIAHFESILKAIASKFKLDQNLEVTLEYNPGFGDVTYLRQLYSLGFNRLSVGVQSSSFDVLKFLGRVHSFDMAKSSINDARCSGFENISADFLIGIPGQNKANLTRCLNSFLNLNLEHISIYQLKIEHGTVFSNLPISTWMSDDDVASLFEFAVLFLTKNNYNHYEISNFAKRGFECRHNLKYWLQEPYLGFGPSAHSFYKGKRFYCPANLKLYLANDFKKKSEQLVFSSQVEWFMLRLRLNEYISFNELKRHGFSAKNLEVKLKNLHSVNLCEVNSRGFKLTCKGFLLQNSILAYLLEF